MSQDKLENGVLSDYTNMKPVFCSSEDNAFDFPFGAMVAILETNTSWGEKNVSVYVLDTGLDTILFNCPQDKIMPVDCELFTFVKAIADPTARGEFVKSLINNPEKQACIRSFLPNSIVKCKLPNSDEILTCVIRYIGDIPEIRYGSFFCLEVLVILFFLLFVCYLQCRCT